MTIDARRSFLGFFVLLAAVLGCGSALQSNAQVEGVKVPGELQADFQMFASNCSKCHDLSRAITAPIDDVEHWNRYVARMARTPGSGISPREAPAILRFLHWHTQQRMARREDKQ